MVDSHLSSPIYRGFHMDQRGSTGNVVRVDFSSKGKRTVTVEHQAHNCEDCQISRSLRHMTACLQAAAKIGQDAIQK